MAAYMIVLSKLQGDRETFISDYAVPTAKLVAQHGGEYVVRAPELVCLEGFVDAKTSVVVSKFPAKSDIEALWNCEAYQKLKPVRRVHSSSTILVVEMPDS
ncbi:DUF1330 domain-containing protein [Henriciella sp. AS95]|uniref:DUF1330 domain-containing protein n=1 Tax=Henriciella sp. AS95 TaxID=3135782 RepID=UPI0031788705